MGAQGPRGPRSGQAAVAGAGTEHLGLVGIQETHDPCHWERVSQPWEVVATPLEPGQFRNRKTFLATPNCVLYQESFDTRLRVRALSPEGMLAYTVPIRSGSRTAYFNRPLHEQGLPATLPGGAEALLEAGQVHIMVLMRLSLLRRVLSPEQTALLEAGAAAHLLPAPAGAVERIGVWLNGILARTHGAPEMLRFPAATQALERELVLGLVGAIALPERRALPERASVRSRGFDRAIQCIRHGDLSTLDQSALCAAAGVSPRTLEYAFRENLGLSPAAFVRQLRLHALRRDLLASALGESTVTDLAFRLGFTHLGRLAGDYRRTFGEPPFATLARPHPGEAPVFWKGRAGLDLRAA